MSLSFCAQFEQNGNTLILNDLFTINDILSVILTATGNLSLKFTWNMLMH